MKNNCDIPAFPAKEIDDDQSIGQNRIIVKEMHLGMSLRDWYAGKALTTFCGEEEQNSCMTQEMIAVWCYQMADEMLIARNK